MSAFTRIGDQNPIGETLRVSAERYQEKMQSYKDAADETDDGLVPADSNVFIPGLRYNWDGTPVVLETGFELHSQGSCSCVQIPAVRASLARKLDRCSAPSGN